MASSTRSCCFCPAPVRWVFPHFEKACDACRPRLQRASVRRAQRRYAAARYRRYRAVGACGWCGVPTGRNRRTGKPFALCLAHRVQDSVGKAAA